MTGETNERHSVVLPMTSSALISIRLVIDISRCGCLTVIGMKIWSWIIPLLTSNRNQTAADDNPRRILEVRLVMMIFGGH